MEIIIASNNRGKIKEYKDLLEPIGFEVFSQGEKNIKIEVEETGKTFEENAKLKAKAIYDITHKCVLSDDSGIEIEALNNEPGIYSARYMGLKSDVEIRKKILELLENKENRKAKFTSCICFIDEDGKEHIFIGTWDGEISLREEGTNGFGYDSIFIAKEADGQTTASMPVEVKEKYSHRAKAVKKLLEYFKNN